MEFKIKRCSCYSDIIVNIDNTKIELGLHNKEERKAFAQTLINAAYELGPSDYSDCDEWFADILKQCGIKIIPTPEKEAQ